MYLSKLTLYFCFIMFSSSLLFSMNEVVLNQKKSENKYAELNQFIDSIYDLQSQDLLDGEILVVKGDQVLLHELSQDISSFRDPQFMIGSNSKQFFAVALLKALYDFSLCDTEQDKINEVKAKLHEPLSNYLPEGSAIWAENMPTWANQVSLHHLLTHTSGIPNYVDCSEYSKQLTPDRKFCEFTHSSAEIIQLISNKDLLFQVGSNFSYSCTNYVIIADVIEAITEKTASDYLQELLFDPLGLSSTTNPDEGKWLELKLNDKYYSLVPQWKYDSTGNQDIIYPDDDYSENLSCAKGSGSIISSASDLLIWNQAIHKSRLILPDQLYDIFTTNNMHDYGYGIGVKNTNFGKMLSHKGKIGTYQSMLYYFPEHDLSIILLSHISADYDKLENEYDALLLSLKCKIPDETERVNEANKIISKKYPSSRGFLKIEDSLNILLNNT